MNWEDATRRLLARMAGHHAMTEALRESYGQIAPQPVVMIPGMTIAEPCMISKVYTPELHPADAIAELKVNGIRGLAPPAYIVTREAQPFNAALHCRPSLDLLEKAYGEPMVFDGEYTEEGGFYETVAAYRRGIGAGVFWIFDAVPYSEWKRNKFTQPLHVRKALLQEKMLTLQTPFVGTVTGWRLNPLQTAAKARELWLLGYEGLVVKNANALYQRGKTNDSLKLKQKQTMDLRVRDTVEEGGRVKTLIADAGRGAHRIGSAIPEELRAEWAANPESIVGKIIEVGYNDINDNGRLLGAHFVRIRGDKENV